MSMYLFYGNMLFIKIYAYYNRAATQWGSEVSELDSTIDSAVAIGMLIFISQFPHVTDGIIIVPTS